MNIEYKLSGQSGYLIIVALFVGVPLNLLLSISRAFLEVWAPDLDFIFFLLGLLGIYFIQRFVIKLSKCRNETAAIRYGIALAILAIYANWCAFFYFDMTSTGYTPGLIAYLSDPLSILKNMSEYAETRVYDLYRNIKVNHSFFAWAIWIIDALLILFCATFHLLHEKIFCEDCNKWVTESNHKLKLTIPENHKEAFTIDSDLKKLFELSPPEVPDTKCIQLNIHQCSTCTNTNTLNIDLLTYSTDKHGKIKENNDDYSPVYSLTSAQVDQFLRKKA